MKCSRIYLWQLDLLVCFCAVEPTFRTGCLEELGFGADDVSVNDEGLLGWSDANGDIAVVVASPITNV